MHPPMVSCRRSSALAAVALLTLGAGSALAQESKSAALAKEVVQLAGGEMRYVAAKVPDSNDEYIAALHIPGVQLLVIWAKYQQPVFLNEMLAKRDYQNVYTDLNSASYTIAASRIFIEDLRGDGLFPQPPSDSTAFDMYEAGGKRFMFDGDAKKQKLSDKEYQDAFASADARYTKALGVLLAELKKKGS